MEKLLTLREIVRGKPLLVTLTGHPPSVNHTYGYSRHGVYKKTEASRWQAWAIHMVRMHALEAYGTSNLSSVRGEPLKLEMRFIRPLWRSKSGPNKGKYVRPDISNFVKILEDSVMMALGAAGKPLEDSAVVELIVLKLERQGEPRTEIRLEFLNLEGN